MTHLLFCLKLPTSFIIDSSLSFQVSPLHDSINCPLLRPLLSTWAPSPWGCLWRYLSLPPPVLRADFPWRMGRGQGKCPGGQPLNVRSSCWEGPWTCPASERLQATFSRSHCQEMVEAGLEPGFIEWGEDFLLMLYEHLPPYPPLRNSQRISYAQRLREVETHLGRSAGFT